MTFVTCTNYLYFDWMKHAVVVIGESFSKLGVLSGGSSHFPIWYGSGDKRGFWNSTIPFVISPS
jgi:hypothetical protein